MLNKIRIHAAKTTALWFNAADIAKILAIKSCNLTIRKNIVCKSFLIDSKSPKNYINEPSFRLLFKDNLDMLAELDMYKLTGELAVSDRYSELLVVACAIVEGACKLKTVKLPNNKEQSYTSFKNNLLQKPVLEALVMLYCEAVFYEESAVATAVTTLIFTKYPVKFDLEYLYNIWKSGIVPSDLTLALKTGQMGSSKLNLETFEIALVCHAIYTRLNSRTTTARHASQTGVTEESSYWGLGPSVKLNKNWYEYPIIELGAVIPNGSEILWHGE